jgi:hypothetical protein
LRRKWTGVRVAVRQWRRRKKAEKYRDTPLREFIYLDEVSVYSLNASRLGAIAAEFTNTETTSLQSGGTLSLSGNVGAAKAGAKASESSTQTQQSQVIRRSIVQTTFREFYEYEKDRLATRPVPEAGNVADVDSLDDLDAKEKELKADGLIIDPKQLARGALLEIEVELETAKIFQFSTIIKELVEIIQENISLFGIDEESFNEGRSYGRIIEQLLAGLIPIRGLAVDYVRMVFRGRELIVHRKLSERLMAGGLSEDGPLETFPFYVVGVTEEALYWKDIRRVLFSGTRFHVLCRLAQDGIQDSWTPIKLRDVLAKMSPEMAEHIDTLSSGDLFGGTSDEENGSDDKKRRVLRAALYGYTASFAEEHGRGLAPSDVLAVQNIVERYQESFETTAGMKEGFQEIAARLASSFGVKPNSGAEKERRLHALDEVGLSLAGELNNTTVLSDDAPPQPTQEEYVLDAEFIAIYW